MAKRIEQSRRQGHWDRRWTDRFHTAVTPATVAAAPSGRRTTVKA